MTGPQVNGYVGLSIKKYRIHKDQFSKYRLSLLLCLYKAKPK